MEDSKTRRGRKTGSRLEVWEGFSERTAGGLRRDDLVYNERSGKICTKKEVERGKRLSELMQRQREKKQEVSAEVSEEAPQEFADFDEL
jgi:hypothetical protein